MGGCVFFSSVWFAFLTLVCPGFGSVVGVLLVGPFACVGFSALSVRCVFSCARLCRAFHVNFCVCFFGCGDVALWFSYVVHSVLCGSYFVSGRVCLCIVRACYGLSSHLPGVAVMCNYTLLLSRSVGRL